MRRFKRNTNLGVYLLIALTCCLFTVGIEITTQGTASFRSFAER